MFKLYIILMTILTAVLAVAMVLSLTVATPVAQSSTTTYVSTTTTFGPAYVQADIYVCHIPTTSTEYSVDNSVDWAWLQSTDIVLVWEISNSPYRLAEFKNDVALFQRYTHLSISVEESTYVAKQNDFVIPVTVSDMDEEYAAMTRISTSFFENGYARPGWMTMAFNDSWFMKSWTTDHTFMVLHELGHVIGLDHTHEAEGMQVNSIMSYEAPRVSYYLPGDIAGLRSVLCK